VDGKRLLIVTADDYGIGPATSQGILELARSGPVTCSVLLVTSPHAEQAVRSWNHAGKPLELGWHPCLTLDRPITPPEQVPSLVNAEGLFWPLGTFVRRLWLGRIQATEIDRELRAQYQRFRDLLGHPPSVINFHHHVQIFPPVGALLHQILASQQPLPYVRRIREPWFSLLRIPGARRKRAFLSLLGAHDARQQERKGLPGNEWLAGVTDPPWVHDPRFLARWLTAMPGQVVELTCHPGYLDSTLLGRDCTPEDGQLQRREQELHLLRHPSFREACGRAGFTVVSPSEFIKRRNGVIAHAA
jgi:predicted glycoside hydrolase/deacetylase ChbG (UPF0249 family)